MTTLSVPIRRTRAYVKVVRSDSLVRNSLYMMMSTVVTAGLGYVFWIVTAHFFSSAQVGIASAVISLCSTVSLLTYLGSWATLIERLHMYERSRKWNSVLARVCVATAALTAAVAAIAVPILAHSKNYGSFFGAASAVAIAIVGAAVWTLVNLFSAAFIAARRADGLLSIQTVVSVLKLGMVIPVATLGAGSLGIVAAWTVSALLGVVFAAVWLIPRLGVARRPASLGRHRVAIGRSAAEGGRPDSANNRTNGPRQPYTMPRHRRTGNPGTSSLRRLFGQHLTSVGGAATPLILPVLVVLRLGDTPNAYFYITWMVGGVFFMVSPSISSALFAESVRVEARLQAVVVKALRVSMFLLIPAMIVMLAGGKLILTIFGPAYAYYGYGLLIILAISAVPDAVSNIAVAVFRVTGHINYSAVLNIGMMIVAIAGTWFLLPIFGIVGAGVAWLGAQILGALASVPAYVNLGEKVVV